MASLDFASYLLSILLSDLRQGRISWSQARFALRRQRAISSAFRHAKHAAVGGRRFVDPFAPYYPSPYFEKVIRNFTGDRLPPKPTYAQIAITNLCPCACLHCHVQNTQHGDLPKEKILELIRKLALRDFPLLFFVGGEPFSRFDDLVSFVEAARGEMDTRLFTSGVGSTPERLRRLKSAGLVGLYVSLDHHLAAEHDRKRSHPGAFAAACATLREASELGFYVSAVCCTTAAMVRDGSFREVVDLAESLGAHSIQLNEIRPVGSARGSPEPDLHLSQAEKAVLVGYYEAQNASERPISIAMPWYLEAPERLGCMATSAQKVYVDAQGNVQPCELLKVSFGNVLERDFLDIWDELRAAGRYPVRDCIVHDYQQLLAPGTRLPLDPAETRRTWPQMTALPPADVYPEIFPELAGSELRDLDAFAARYPLDLAPGVDFELHDGHWLPRLLGSEYVALGTTLYAREAGAGVPDHELLHLAQFRRHGRLRVLGHYLRHAVPKLIANGDLAEAFRQVPFEVEARAYAELRRREDEPQSYQAKAAPAGTSTKRKPGT